ncbi:MAG: LLM class flavin-dependent oxidoreductase [Caulobacteraceae bacterium]|nr:LLM class flavin-dependent oxidoreductase [Caulobacteraceae bacterium]
MTELWIQTALGPMKEVQTLAGRFEADGWKGVMVFDSQSLIADPYMTLAFAAAATRTLKLGIGVSNPVTRHAAVSASALAALQEASGGRATLGIGRGNSSLAYLGAAPASLAEFEDYVRLLQALLSGGAAPVEQLLTRSAGLRPLDPETLGRAPDEARLKWLDRTVPKAMVEVAATGPKAIALGVRQGDRLSFSVGADQTRLAEAIAQARAAAEQNGRTAPLGLTAYVSVAALADKGRARRLAAPDVAMHAHIAALNPANLARMSEAERGSMEKIAKTYDMTRHARHGAQTEGLDDAFIDAHAVVGAPAECVARLKAIAALGLDRLVLMMPMPLKDDPAESYANVVREVLPAFAG